jgi:hypothetical protein
LVVVRSSLVIAPITPKGDIVATLHDDWKGLKKTIGDFAKALPEKNFGKSLDELETAATDFEKKCAEVQDLYDKLMAKRKTANELMGEYGNTLSKNKDFNTKHGTEWLKFVSSLKKPMIKAGTAFNNAQKKCEATLKKAAGL